MRRAVLLLSLIGLGGGAQRAVAQVAPQQVIRAAIAAHGGYERLSRVRADRVAMRGTLYANAKPVSFTSETLLQLPAQFRGTVHVHQAGTVHTIVHLLDGDRAAILIDDKPQTVSAVNLVQLRQTLQLDAALRLVPLLTDARYRLNFLGEAVVNGAAAHGIQVLGLGQRDLKLWFDKRTALLLKTEYRLDGPGGKDVKQEAWYSDIRDVGGYKRPCKVVVYRDGHKVMDADLVKAERVDRIDPAEFRRP